MGDPANSESRELFDGVAEHLREPVVDLDELSVERRERHSERRRVERTAETRFALLQLLDESPPLLELVRVAKDAADELRHQACRLHGQLVERVRLTAEDRQRADDLCVAVQRCADERSRAERGGRVPVDARIGLRVACVLRLAGAGSEPREARLLRRSAGRRAAAAIPEPWCRTD